MFWQFVLAVSVAVALIQLGALSVWVSVLSLFLKAVAVLAVGIFCWVAGLFMWRRYKGFNHGR